MNQTKIYGKLIGNFLELLNESLPRVFQTITIRLFRAF